MMKKTITPVAFALIAISIPIIITTFATESVAFSDTFFLQQFQKLDLESTSGFSGPEYLHFSNTLQKYFRLRLPSPQLLIQTGDKLEPLYRQGEIAHLEDVQHLFQRELLARNLSCIMLIAGLGLLVATKQQRPSTTIAAAIISGCSIGITAFLLLLFAVWRNFKQAFTIFHLIAFDNMLWQLDPAQDNLLKLFPEQFFFNATTTIAIRVLCPLIILLGGSIWYYKKVGNKSS